MHFSILIPTHGRSTLLGRTLTSLGACLLPEGYAETVVVENGPRAGAEAVVAEAARAHPDLRLRYLHVEQANKSNALNEALETMGEGLVVFFDDDVRFDPGVLVAYAEVAAAHPERAFFGGPFGCDYDESPPEWLRPFLPFSARGVRFDDGERPEDYLGFNWAAYAEEILGAGGFDPAFGPGSPSGNSGQESEMQWRLRDQGAVAVDVPGAFVWHYVPVIRCSPAWAATCRLRKGRALGRTAEEHRVKLLLTSAAETVRCGLVWTKHKARVDEVGQWKARYGMNYHRGHVQGILQSWRERA